MVLWINRVTLHVTRTWDALAEYRLLFFGALLLFVLWLAPEGLVGTALRLLTRHRPRRLAPCATPWPNSVRSTK